MILDNISLSGKDAYLKSSNGNINLHKTASSTTSKKGSSPILGKGIVMDISGINLCIESANLYSLFERTESAATPLISIDVNKEMFPGLVADPYKHRVHKIAGFDDFGKGSFINCKAMEVDGYPTIVSTGKDTCSWKSEKYDFRQMPDKKFKLASAAWDLVSSKLAPDDEFVYTITLHIWKSGRDLNNAPSVSNNLATNKKPVDARMIQQINNWAKDIIGYQLEFIATVKYDSYIEERYSTKMDQRNLGRPLLRSINLLEPVEPVFDFYSMQEIISNASSFHFLDEHSGNPKRFIAEIAITAALEEGESIVLNVHTNKFSSVLARVNGKTRIKPPIVNT